MRVRANSPLVGFVALVASCSPGNGEPPPVAAGEEHIACAVDGATEMSEVCAIERHRQDDALYLVVRHPDGGFRRFEVLKDGRGLATADGAVAAETALDGGMLEVVVENDHYLFPATVKDDASIP